MRGHEISYEAALALIAAHVPSLAEARRVAVADAPGFVLGEPIVADRDQPPFDQARLDGFAVQAASLAVLPVRLPIAGAVRAGESTPPALARGTAMRINTGAPVPAGADTVVRIEDCRVDAAGAEVSIQAWDSSPAIARRGSDGARGEVLLGGGERLGVRHIAVLATAGRGEVVVRAPRRPATVLSGGDELVGAGAAAAAHAIRNSNGPTLVALLARLGFPAQEGGVMEDRLAAHRDALESALAHSDLVVTSGGVSMGDHDFMPDAIAALGGTLLFDRVAIQPGKPVTLARVGDGKVVLALPGNPCSAFVTCLTLGAAVIGQALGVAATAPATRRRLVGATLGRGARRRFLPAVTAGDDDVRLVPWNGSGDLLGFSRAEVLVVVPPASSAAPDDGRFEILELP